MNDLSVRGVYRRYVVEPRIALFGTDDPVIVGDPQNISVAKDIMASGSGWLRSYLEPLAFTVVGPASWYQNVCDNIVGGKAFHQTWTHIDVRIMLDPDADPRIDIGSLQVAWKTEKDGIEGIELIWNNPTPVPGAARKQWKCARAGEVPCRVSFRVHWVTTAPHHVVAVHYTTNPNPPTDEYNWYTTDTGPAAAHEFGHMLGLPDEYAQSDCPGRTPVATGTVMDTNTSVIPQRLVQWVADEIGSDLQ